MKNTLIFLIGLCFNFLPTISYADSLPINSTQSFNIQPILNDIHHASECVEHLIMQKWDNIEQSKEDIYQDGLDNCSLLNSNPKTYYIFFKPVQHEDKRPVGIRAFVVTPFLLNKYEKISLEQHILNYNEIYQPAYMEENILHSTVRALSIHNGQEKTILIYKQTFIDEHNDSNHLKNLGMQQLILDITIDYPL